MKTLNYCFAISFAAFMIISCGNKTAQVKDQTVKDSTLVKDTSSTSNQQENKWTSYQGILPCKSCDGITTTVSFSSDNQTASLSFTHLDNPFIEQGFDYPMNTERGFEDDPDATVYILNPDMPVNDQRYFVRSTGKDNEIIEIGKNRKKIKDGKNHTLTKMN